MDHAKVGVGSLRMMAAFGLKIPEYHARAAEFVDAHIRRLAASRKAKASAVSSNLRHQLGPRSFEKSKKHLEVFDMHRLVGT